MKLNKTIILLFFILFTLGMANHAYSLWPTVDDNPRVCGSYGTNEANLFHDAIDIYGIYGVNKVRTISKVKVIKLTPPGHNEEIILAELDEQNNLTGTYFHYGHLIIDRSVIPDVNIILVPNTIFADITDKAGQQNYPNFPHTHFVIFRYAGNPDMVDWLDDYGDTRNTVVSPNSVNPLKNPYINLSVPDPANNPPKIGPVFLEASNYLDPTVTPYPYGKLNICAEITDNMGYIYPPDPSPYDETRSWEPHPSQLVNCITSSPYEFLYEILDSSGNAKISKTFKFSGFVSHYTTANLLYNQSFTVANNYCYTFNLTNIFSDQQGNPAIAQGYWNTKLKEVPGT